jgi:hypothetical protein
MLSTYGRNCASGAGTGMAVNCLCTLTFRPASESGVLLEVQNVALMLVSTPIGIIEFSGMKLPTS